MGERLLRFFQWNDLHIRNRDITAGRNAFVERAFERIGSTPALVLTHVPLIAMRDEAALVPSFGFSSWTVLDEGLLAIVEERAEQVVAVLCGHIHLTAARVRRGIHHIMPSGTAGYPAEERRFSIPLEGGRRPGPGAVRELVIVHESAPGQWQEADWPDDWHTGVPGT